MSRLTPKAERIATAADAFVKRLHRDRVTKTLAMKTLNLSNQKNFENNIKYFCWQKAKDHADSN